MAVQESASTDQSADGDGAGSQATAADVPTGLMVTLIGLTFVMNTFGRGVTETFAVFLLPVEAAFSASRSEITATYSVYMLVHGIAAPFAGQLVDRFGGRLTYCAGLSLLGGGYVLGGMAETVPQYYVTVGAMSGLGAACLGMVVASSLLSRWFTRRLGSVMSIPYAAVGFGVLLVPPITQYLLTHYDWRMAHTLLGLAVLALLPLLFLLPLARLTRGSPEWQAQRISAAETGAPMWTVSRALKTPAFWALFSVYFWTAVAAYTVLPQSVAFLVENGFDPLVAAGAFGVTGALSTVGIMAMGWISDRFGRLPATVVSYLMSMSGVACLIAVVWWPHLIFVYAFVTLFGLMQGARGPIIAALAATLYRGGSVGAIFGALSFALGIGAAAGSLLSGLLHDLTHDYVASFSLAIVASLLGMLSYVGSGSLRRERL
ncbi:MAG: MFS transporter [Pseudomonadota bacterium]